MYVYNKVFHCKINQIHEELIRRRTLFRTLLGLLNALLTKETPSNRRKLDNFLIGSILSFWDWIRRAKRRISSKFNATRAETFYTTIAIQASKPHFSYIIYTNFCRCFGSVLQYVVRQRFFCFFFLTTYTWNLFRNVAETKVASATWKFHWIT